MRLQKSYDRANKKIQRPLTSGGRKTKGEKMSFEINIPSKHAAIELSPTFKGDLTLVFDNDFLPILAKQVINEINIADLARLFDGEQIEELKKALFTRELDNEASEIGLLK